MARLEERVDIAPRLTTHSTGAELAWISFARIEGCLAILPARLIRALDAFEIHMLLPMFGFILMLIVVGGLASLVAVGDSSNARLAPFIGFVALFAGLGALFLSFGLAWLSGVIFRSETVAGAGFFGGYVAGGLGGAVFGLKRALGRRRRIESEAHE